MFKFKNLLLILTFMTSGLTSNVSVAGELLPVKRSEIPDLEKGLLDDDCCDQDDSCCCTQCNGIKRCGSRVIGCIKNNKKTLGMATLLASSVAVHNFSPSAQIDTSIAMMNGSVLGDLLKNKLIVAFPVLIILALASGALDHFVLEPNFGGGTNFKVIFYTAALACLGCAIKDKI